jgi:hypothetical protein
VATLSPAEIAGLLDERFRLLTGGRRTAVERHRTLRAAVDWSYSLLSRTEQHVFDRLGVFSGSFDTAAAVAVAGVDGPDDWAGRQALAALVRKSMINRVAAEAPASRYQLLETLRASRPGPPGGARRGRPGPSLPRPPLRAAAASSYVLLTENVADFARPATKHLTTGGHHPGVPIALSSRFSRRRAGISPIVEAIGAAAKREPPGSVLCTSRNRPNGGFGTPPDQRR